LLLAAALLAATPISPVSAGAVSTPVEARVVFNDPLTGEPVPGAPSPITAAVIDVLSRATTGSTVRIAMYEWNYDGVLDSESLVGSDVALIDQALVGAVNAGAIVKVVLDDEDWNDEPIRSLRTQPEMAGVFVRCVGGCFSGAGNIQHNKFVLADRLLTVPRAPRAGQAGFALDTVLQMTSNWTDLQLNSHNWNSAIEIVGDKDLFEGYADYFYRLRNCAQRTTHHCTTDDASDSSFSTPTERRVSTFPRPNGDPVLTDLRDIGCPGTVDVAVNKWQNDARGRSIEQALFDLTQTKRPCTVRLVVPYKTGSESIVPRLKKDFPTTVHCSTAGTGLDPRNVTPAVHSKYVLVAGTYHDVPGSTMVFTGSETFGTDALRANDNIWFNVRHAPGNPDVYAQYEANFEQLWASTPPCVSLPKLPR
jgi:hypothetical protein